MERLTGRLHRLRAILDHPRMATVRAVLADYDAAGGGLLAGGLAYAGLLAVLSGILLVIGATGFFVGESERLEIVGEIGRRLPPLGASSGAGSAGSRRPRRRSRSWAWPA